MISYTLFVALLAAPAAIASSTGKMTMWSAADDVIVGSSCEYANSAQGGLSSPAATSPYITSHRYCAVSAAVFEGGLACGRCYRLTFDGSDTTETTGCATSGSTIIQVVDSGSAKEFDCQETVFQEISGCTTGVMGITYEEVECEGTGPPTATVLDGDNAWYTKLIFSGLSRAVSSASITVGTGNQPIELARNGGATWAASTPVAIAGNVPVSFKLTLDNSDIVEMDACFNTWPQPTSASCTSGAGNDNESNGNNDSNGDNDNASNEESSDDTEENSDDDTPADSSNCAAQWGQCAGPDMVTTCCEEGTQCYKASNWYSQCLTACPPGWECNGRRRNLRGLFRKN